MSVVVPFRRPEKKAPPPDQEPSSYCPQCGWKMPTAVRADRDSVEQALSDGQLLLYIDCPDCGVVLFLVVKFDLDTP